MRPSHTRISTLCRPSRNKHLVGKLMSFADTTSESVHTVPVRAPMSDIFEPQTMANDLDEVSTTSAIAQ